MNKTSQNTNKLVSTALMSVIIAVSAWITVPFTVPFTMQIFGVFMALMLLGGTYGSLSILIYILLGLFGMPVFSGFSGGFGIIMGPTGGYIVGFLAMGLVVWSFSYFEKGEPPVWIYLIALFICYIFGTIWFCYVMGTMGNRYGFVQALMLCVVPYIIPDIMKFVLARVVSSRIKKMLPM